MPKKAPKADKEKAEKVEPKTIKEVAQEYMVDMLKSAGTRRSQSIKLSNCPYGQDLAKDLLDKAERIEKLFKHMQTAMDKSQEAALDSLLRQAQSVEAAADKAKAWCGFLSKHSPNHCQTFDCFGIKSRTDQLFVQLVPHSHPHCLLAGGCWRSLEEAYQEEGEGR